jgi:uncharacterized protein YuzE
MNMSRDADAAYLYLTHIADGEVNESFSTEDYFDDWRDAKEAIIDVGHDGRVLGIEWLGSDMPEVVRPDVRYHVDDNHAVVWLIEAGVQSVAKPCAFRPPRTTSFPVPSTSISTSPAP